MFHFISDYRAKNLLFQLSSKTLVLLEAAFLFLVSLKAHNLLPKTLRTRRVWELITHCILQRFTYIMQQPHRS